MARTIATVSGIGLVPGISANRRLYTPEMVQRATERLAERIKAGNAPANMLSFHGAGDNSREITASLTGARLDDGRLRFDGAITATEAGRDIASLADTTDGKPAHLKNVSIRGYWLGTVRKVKGPDGQPVETADDLEIDGIDWTKNPGVTGAEIDTFAWAGGSETAETTGRIAICESAEEALVTFTEAVAEGQKSCADMGHQCCRDAAGGAAEALIPVPHVLENGICVTCEESPPMSKRGSGLTGAGRQWADPGYQKDKKQRYDISTKANAKAAWAYVNQKDNAEPYTATQLKRIKDKIKKALGRFGVSVASESADWADGWTYDTPVSIGEAVAEYYGDSSRMGSWCVSASNGPVNLSLSSYCVDPEDLDVILRAAADAACKALAALDPDMDGDIDVPGAGDGSDTDGDAGKGESAPADDLTETTPAAPAATTETEDSMTETTIPAETAAPGIDHAALNEAVTKALEAREAARQARKAAKRAARETAASEAARQAQENAALGQGIPATAGAAATETAEQRMARLSALADRKFAEAAAREGLAAEETDEQILDRLLEEKLVPLRQARAEQGGAHRKGIAQLEAIADSPQAGKTLQEASNEDLKYLAGAAFGPRGTR